MNPTLREAFALGLDTLVKLAALTITGLVVTYTPKLVATIRGAFEQRTATDAQRAASEALAYVSTLIAKGVASKAERVRDAKDPANTFLTWDAETARRLMFEVITEAKDAAPEQMALIRAGLARGESLDNVLHRLGEAEVEALRRRPLMVPATLMSITQNVAPAAVTQNNVAQAPGATPPDADVPTLAGTTDKAP